MQVKIKRCDPMGIGTCEAFLQAYEVEVNTGMTVLQALLKIVDEQDPSVTFRRSCRSAICGSCSMMINGRAKLACNTSIEEEFEKFGEIKIEPLKNHTVIKDLVVDQNPFWEKLYSVKPYLEVKEGAEKVSMSNEDEQNIDDAQKCIMCGACNAMCSALEADDKYVGPSALAKAWRFVGDKRDDDKFKRLFNLSHDHGMWDCVRCVSCTEYCPKGVKPLEQIEKLREQAMKRGILDNPGAKHADALYDSVKRIGRLDEATMTFKTLGILKSLGMIPFGLKMETHGKMPHPILFPKIEKMEEVKKIYELMEEKRETEKLDFTDEDKRNK